MLVSALSVQDK